MCFVITRRIQDIISKVPIKNKLLYLLCSWWYKSRNLGWIALNDLSIHCAAIHHDSQVQNLKNKISSIPHTCLHLLKKAYILVPSIYIKHAILVQPSHNSTLIMKNPVLFHHLLTIVLLRPQNKFGRFSQKTTTISSYRSEMSRTLNNFLHVACNIL